jgi:pimeloyl-ACP methyl ester carboxylesterase
MLYGQLVAEAEAVQHVSSADGTRIGYRRNGEGPPRVLVHGSTGAHWRFRFLVPTLVDRFTVYAVDRPGRGESGDRAEYAIERAFEDVAAVVDSIDEPASVLAHSYGATVALGAALVARNLHRLVLYEPTPACRWCRARISSGSKISSRGTSARRRSSTRCACSA